MSELLIPIIIALIVSFTPKVRYLAQTLGTIVHELGHAVVVMPFGGRLQGIKLRLNTEGEAVVGIPRYPFPFYQILRIVNLFAGYSAPVYFSFLLYVSLVFEWNLFLQILFGVMSVIVLLFIRNWFGIIIAVGFAAVNTVFIVLLPEFIDEYALTLAVILFIRGVIDIYQAAGWTFRNKLEQSDFTLAAKELHGSPQLWFVLFACFHATLITGLLVLWFAVLQPYTV